MALQAFGAYASSITTVDFHGQRVRVKKPHKSKPRKATPAPQRAGKPGALVANSTRRPPAPSRPDPRRLPPRRIEPTTVYRRPNPLRIESTDDRLTFRLLLLPFIVMAFVISVVPALHVFPTLNDLISATPQTELVSVADVPSLSASPAATPTPSLANTATLSAPRLPQPAPLVSEDIAAASSVTLAPTHLAAVHPVLLTARTTSGVKIAKAAAVPPALTVSPSTSTAILRPAPPHTTIARSPQPTSVGLAVGVSKSLAPSASRPAFVAPNQSLALLSPVAMPKLRQPIPAPPYEVSCPVTYASAAPPVDSGIADSSSPFGQRLAAAAAEQTRHFVIYDDKYRQISRIVGDVPPLYGVCTDVVIRAYRTLGVDLQSLVQASRLGAGDPNIDHRRTETLRRYLARYGQELAVTPYGEDYLPGDIVTYWRPQNSGSRSHIAIVAGTLGPSGRPMIIHNRGWGPQIEDALFVDRITGHYRYDATIQPPAPQIVTKAKPFLAHPPATPITLRPSTPTPPSRPTGL